MLAKIYDIGNQINGFFVLYFIVQTDFFNHMLMLHQDFISVLSRRGSIVVPIRLERKEGLMSKQ